MESERIVEQGHQIERQGTDRPAQPFYRDRPDLLGLCLGVVSESRVGSSQEDLKGV